MDNINKELFERNLINNKQFKFLEAIRTNKIISLYYELRIILYLGIMLFTAGIGYFAYQNMGEIGHLISMVLIVIAIAAGFFFIRKFAEPYSNLEVTVSQVYFDYILILVALLIISLFTYVQVYFNLVELLLNWTSFISAAILLLMSYRFDNRALLSMGITALAAAVGISITPVDWTNGEWAITSDLYLISILLGLSLIIVDQVTYWYSIKKHFRFTFQNFGLILYFVGCITATFDSNYEFLYAVLMLVSASIVTYYTWKKKEFLFFLYSNITIFIGITYLLYLFIDTIDGNNEIFIYYFPFACIAYIIFLVKKKSHFAHD